MCTRRGEAGRHQAMASTGLLTTASMSPYSTCGAAGRGGGSMGVSACLVALG